MTTARAGTILLLLAFAGVGAARLAGSRRTVRPSGLSSSQSETQRFWQAYRQASSARVEDQPAAAIPLYQQALALRPAHEDSLYYLGNCYLELGRYPEAAAACRRLIAANPLSSSRGYAQLALLHADRRPGAPFDLPKAAQYFQQALRINPNSGALLGSGEVVLLQGDAKRAEKILRDVDAENATSVAAPYLLGYLCWRRGEKAEACSWFQRAVQHCKVKKPPVAWSQEGEIKANPELRWQALARQSVFGSDWLRLRRYAKSPRLSLAVMEPEYRRLDGSLDAARRPGAMLKGMEKA